MRDTNTIDSTGYANNGFSSSSSTLNEEPHGGLKGSNDFILTCDTERKKNKTWDRLKSILPWKKENGGPKITKKMVYRRLPVLNWAPKYSGQDALGDLVAGITVGLTVIPQALAYSNMAGLPAQYGLYGSFFGCIIYIFFGSCKDIPMGPTAIVSLLTSQIVNGKPENAILLTFLAGIVEILMGLFGLGFIINFVSGPVSSGFTSAAALIIVTSQIKDILGIPAKGSTFVEMWRSITNEIGGTKLADSILGATCIIILLLMRLVSNIHIHDPKAAIDEDTKRPIERKKFQVVNKIFWLIGTSRNAIVVMVCGGIGYWLSVTTEYGINSPFKLIGYIPPGLPTFQAPPFGYQDGNVTVTFFDMVSEMSSGIIIIPLLSLLEDISICKAFANGKAIDATQELIAIGLSNLGNSFFQAFPGTGALSRSAVVAASEGRTPLHGAVTAALVIFALMLAAPCFTYIPRAALGAVIIAAVVFMVEVKVVKPMWRSKKSDLIPGLGTFIACLAFPLEIGILIGISINILFILYHAARPKISIEHLTTHEGTEYLMLTPDRCLIFPSADYVRHLVNKQGTRNHKGKPDLPPVVIDCSHVYGADFTAARVIESITKDFAARSQPLLFYNLKPSVCTIFEGLDPEHLFVYYDEHNIDELLNEKKKEKKEEIIRV